MHLQRGQDNDAFALELIYIGEVLPDFFIFASLGPPMLLYSDHTDDELVVLLRDSDKTAFTEIYNRYWDKLFAVAYHRLYDGIEAEETVQDIFLNLWKRRQSLQLTHTLATYLATAVKYQVITRLARIHREQVRLKDIATANTEGIETTAQWLSEKELRQQIRQCIHTLPEKCRIIFLMSRDEGKTNAQIARELQVAEKTVEGHITKALYRLRRSLPVSLPMLLYLLEK